MSPASSFATRSASDRAAAGGGRAIGERQGRPRGSSPAGTAGRSVVAFGTAATTHEGPPKRRPLAYRCDPRERRDHPPDGTSDAAGIALTVIVNGELTAPWLSGPPGAFTRTVSAPIAKNDCVMA